MRLRFTIILMTLSTMMVFGQVTKEVENGLFVTFPSTPEYQVNMQTASYIDKSTNCFFIVLVQRNVIPYYDKYVLAKKKWTQSEVKKVEDALLDNAAKATLDYTGNKGTIAEIKIGLYSGRKIEYSAINLATGERGKRFSIMLLVRNRLVNFKCWYLKDNTIAKAEKDSFLNSIKTN